MLIVTKILYLGKRSKYLRYRTHSLRVANNTPSFRRISVHGSSQAGAAFKHCISPNRHDVLSLRIVKEPVAATNEQ